jgi:hypothetical protein
LSAPWQPEWIWRAIAWVGLATLLLLAACTSPTTSDLGDTGAGSGRAEALSRISKRLGAAVERVERARSGGTAPAVGELEARRAALQEWVDRSIPAPSSSPPDELPTARLREVQGRVHALAVACEEQALRGSADFYAARAELEWEHSHAKTLAQLMGLPAEAVPDNVYRLVGSDSVKSFQAGWLDTKRAFDVRQATSPPGAYGPAIDRAATQLRALDEALQLGPVDLAARFAGVPNSVFTKAGPWLAEQERARESAIRRREAQLLHEALARDGTDLQALVRLNELARLGESVDAQRADRRALVLTRFLMTTEPSRSRAVRNLIRERVMDPLAAAWRESQLMQAYIDDGAQVPVADWMAAQLNQGDFAEVATWLETTQALLRQATVSTPAFLTRRDLDLRALDTESRAVISALARRTGSDAGTESPRAVPDVSLAAAVPTDLGQLSTERQARLWEALDRLGVRTELAPAVARTRTRLALLGYENAVSSLTSDLESLLLNPSLHKSLLPGSDPSLSAKSAIWEAAIRVRSGVLILYGSDPGRAGDLTHRLEALRQKIRFPPLLDTPMMVRGLGGNLTLRRPDPPTSPDWPSEGMPPPKPPRFDGWGGPFGRPGESSSSDDGAGLERLRSMAARPFSDPLVLEAHEKWQSALKPIKRSFGISEEFERVRKAAEVQREQLRQKEIERRENERHETEYERQRREYERSERVRREPRIP